jgi:hypothetical protein
VLKVRAGNLLLLLAVVGAQMRAPSRSSSQQAEVAVLVAPQYCLPQTFRLAVTNRVLSPSGGDCIISDPEGNILSVCAISDGTVRDLLDDKGNKLIHM